MCMSQVMGSGGDNGTRPTKFGIIRSHFPPLTVHITVGPKKETRRSINDMEYGDDGGG